MKSTKVTTQAGSGIAGRAKSKKAPAASVSDKVRVASERKAPVVPHTKKMESITQRFVEGATLQNGRIHLASKTLPAGTSFSVYLNGHLIGAGTLQAVAAGSGAINHAEVEVKALPRLEYPFEFRFADNATGKEAYPSLLIKDVHQLVAGMGDVPANAKLVALYDGRIDFTFEVAFAPETGRRVALKINGRVASEALSALTSEKAEGKGHHHISLSHAEPLRDGFLVELVDVLTGNVIFRRIPTWTDVVGALTRGQHELQRRLEVIERDLKKLSASAAAASGQARERLLLDRLDMFYALIQERLDKELRVLNPPATVFQGVQVPVDREVDASVIEGTGFYNLEGSGATRWRWFGPNVNLVIRDVSARARELHFSFFSVSVSCNEADISIKVNGHPLSVSAVRHGDRVQVTAPIEHVVFGAATMKSLIVEVGFPYHFQPDGDIRLLSAAFSSVNVRH